MPASADPAGPPSGGAAPAPARSVTERLKELAQLHTEGALSDEEFTAAKVKVLGSTPPDP